ncbi:hypothetical protein BKA70DRAFT_1404603 [Coprinopsis sp. MPI-PUGE-AT-0042]|nr:hypothetical protein BKA70DRAFT_1404603 [Coprinopsis sp. MPI-PUGE-AT-0042]
MPPKSQQVRKVLLERQRFYATRLGVKADDKWGGADGADGGTVVRVLETSTRREGRTYSVTRFRSTSRVFFSNDPLRREVHDTWMDSMVRWLSSVDLNGIRTGGLGSIDGQDWREAGKGSSNRCSPSPGALRWGLVRRSRLFELRRKKSEGHSPITTPNLDLQPYSRRTLRLLRLDVLAQVVAEAAFNRPLLPTYKEQGEEAERVWKDPGFDGRAIFIRCIASNVQVLRALVAEAFEAKLPLSRYARLKSSIDASNRRTYLNMSSTRGTTQISRGCLFGPTLAVVAHWFEVKRSIPMAMIAIGSSLGGATMSILARRLLPKVGEPFGLAMTIQMHGLIFMGSLGLANLLMRRRRPLRNVPGGLFNSRVLKPAPLSVYCGSCFVTFLNSYTMLPTDISGFRPTFVLSVVIMNASSLIGRYAEVYIWEPGLAKSWHASPLQLASFLCLTPGTNKRVSNRTHRALRLRLGSLRLILDRLQFEFGNTVGIGSQAGKVLIPLGLGAIAGPPVPGAVLSASGGFDAVGYHAGTMAFLGVGLTCLVLRGSFGCLDRLGSIVLCNMDQHSCWLPVEAGTPL